MTWIFFRHSLSGSGKRSPYLNPDLHFAISFAGSGLRPPPTRFAARFYRDHSPSARGADHSGSDTVAMWGGRTITWTPREIIIILLTPSRCLRPATGLIYAAAGVSTTSWKSSPRYCCPLAIAHQSFSVEVPWSENCCYFDADMACGLLRQNVIIVS